MISLVSFALKISVNQRLKKKKKMAKYNLKLKTQNSKRIRQGFTLVELMIVVSILGILAAIVIPEFQGHIQQAKEAAAKDNLRILRGTIERYAHDNNGVPPGYMNNNPIDIIAGAFFKAQLTDSAKPYLSEIPKNPFNNKSDIATIENGNAMPGTPTDASGWIYKGNTKTIKLNTSGTDSSGTAYWDY